MGAISVMAKNVKDKKKCELDLATMQKSYQAAINENHIPPPIWDDPWVRTAAGFVLGGLTAMVIVNNVPH